MSTVSVWSFSARQPFSMAYALLVLIIGFIAGPFLGNHREIRGLLGTGYDSVVDHGRWWSPVTSVFIVDNALELVFAVLAAVVVLGCAERLMGTWRTAIAFVVTSVVGASVGILAQSIGVADGEMWSRGVREMFTFDPFTPIAGSIMAASCFAGPLWKRRIRVITLTVLLTLVLYSGQPSDVYRLIAAGAGLALGLAFRPTPVDLSWHRSSDHESRTLLAAVVGVLAVGPLEIGRAHV